MKLWKKILGWSLTAIAVLGTASAAAEIEPPFTWKGKGVASFIAEYGIDEIQFTLEVSVDAEGQIKGKTSSDEGESSLKHMFYGERVEHEVPGYYSRKSILVLMLNETSDEPMLIVLDGRLLAGRFFAGEARVKRYEKGSESDKALGVGDLVATAIDEDYLPSNLRTALKKSMPWGTVKIEGAYAQ